MRTKIIRKSLVSPRLRQQHGMANDQIGMADCGNTTRSPAERFRLRLGGALGQLAERDQDRVADVPGSTLTQSGHHLTAALASAFGADD
jgi:hypothetical protein